jgi:hypothetical protein
MELPQHNDHAQRSVVTRRRAGLLLIVLVATSLLAILGRLLWPEPAADDWYTYQAIAPIRERWWAVLTALSVGPKACPRNPTSHRRSERPQPVQKLRSAAICHLMCDTTPKAAVLSQRLCRS